MFTLDIYCERFLIRAFWRGAVFLSVYSSSTVHQVTTKQFCAREHQSPYHQGTDPGSRGGHQHGGHFTHSDGDDKHSVRRTITISRCQSCSISSRRHGPDGSMPHDVLRSLSEVDMHMYAVGLLDRQEAWVSELDLTRMGVDRCCTGMSSGDGAVSSSMYYVFGMGSALMHAEFSEFGLKLQFNARVWDIARQRLLMGPLMFVFRKFRREFFLPPTQMEKL
jgi:hypothetical protein